VRWRVHSGGFRFDGLGVNELPRQWLDEDTRVATNADAAREATLLLGPEPIIGPQSVLLVSRSQAGPGVRVATDGVRPFAVQAAQ
jgi:general secretion pathway protein H